MTVDGNSIRPDISNCAFILNVTFSVRHRGNSILFLLKVPRFFFRKRKRIPAIPRGQSDYFSSDVDPWTSGDSFDNVYKVVY